MLDDIEELAYRAMGKTEDETEQLINDNNDVNNELHARYEVNFEQYCKIVKDLLKFTPLVRTALTDTLVHAFVDEKASRTIVKGAIK